MVNYSENLICPLIDIPQNEVGETGQSGTLMPQYGSRVNLRDFLEQSVPWMPRETLCRTPKFKLKYIGFSQNNFNEVLISFYCISWTKRETANMYRV